MDQAIKERRANVRRQCSDAMAEIDSILAGMVGGRRTVLEREQLKAARRELAGMIDALDHELEPRPLCFSRWVVDSCPYDDEVGLLLLKVADRYERYCRKQNIISHKND